jgi:hypothetical protein
MMIATEFNQSTAAGLFQQPLASHQTNDYDRPMSGPMSGPIGPWASPGRSICDS